MTGRNYMTRETISTWLGYEYDTLNIVAQFNLIFNATFMVEEGMGYATCLEGLIPETEDSILCFKPFKPQFLQHVSLVWKKNQHFSPVAKKFLERIKNEIHQFGKD